MLWLLDVNIGLSLMPVLCSFQRALRINSKSGVPVAGLELGSKEQYWPLYIIHVPSFIQTVISVAPYYSRTRQTETLVMERIYSNSRFDEKATGGSPWD